MVHKVKAVVAKEKNAPVSIETILVPDPGPGEALVDILTCGVCHTDLHYKQGGINDDFPILLGHEATGVVSAVGPDVTGRGARRPGHPELAGGLRRMPGLRQGPAAVLLQHRTTPPRR